MDASKDFLVLLVVVRVRRAIEDARIVAFGRASQVPPEGVGSADGETSTNSTPMMNGHLRTLVETLWRYHQLNHRLQPADAILVLCSHDKAVAERGAELFLEGWAPLLIFAGGLGAITRHLWTEPEADQFAAVAVAMGVPADRILVENQSTNTGENVAFTRRLLAERGLDPNTFIVVQKPYMERRSYATFRKVWPEKQLIVTSPRASLDEYLARHCNETLSTDDVISIMVGDLQRIRLYPGRGFQIPQDIPADVWDAYRELVALGYDRHLCEPEGERPAAREEQGGRTQE